MNNLPDWKRKLIEWLAGGTPVLMNFTILGKNIPSGMAAILAPHEDERKVAGFYEDKAFLVPTINVK